MASIPKIKENCEEEKQILIIGKQTFRLTIHKCKETHTIYLGGAHTYCINVIILLPGSIYEQFTDISICTLDHLYYNELCSLSGGFKRGVDVQKIFHLIFSYIKKHYKHINKIQLKDYSTRTCDNNNTINLYEKYYITKGKTWYQEKYKAYLNDTDLKNFIEYHKKFQEEKKNMSWEKMKRFMNIVPDYAEKLYESAETWQDFFTDLEKSLGVPKFCQYISPWISTFLNTIMKYDFTAPYYYINIKDITDIDYTQDGGYSSKKTYTRSKKLFASKMIL